MTPVEATNPDGAVEQDPLDDTFELETTTFNHGFVPGGLAFWRRWRKFTTCTTASHHRPRRPPGSDAHGLRVHRIASSASADAATYFCILAILNIAY